MISSASSVTILSMPILTSVKIGEKEIEFPTEVTSKKYGKVTVHAVASSDKGGLAQIDEDGGFPVWVRALDVLGQDFYA